MIVSRKAADAYSESFMIDFEDANEFAPTVPRGYVREWNDNEYGRWMLDEDANFY